MTKETLPSMYGQTSEGVTDSSGLLGRKNRRTPCQMCRIHKEYAELTESDDRSYRIPWGNALLQVLKYTKTDGWLWKPLVST